jgi:glycosyltransferase involved in cell wall biosynthesis
MHRAPVTLVGHAFAPHGMGEALRMTFRALRAASVDARVRDIAMYDASVVEKASDVHASLVPRLDSRITIFVMNADERERGFRRLGAELEHAGRRIVYPMWELSQYPEPWARELDQYDEVWAASRFSGDAFARSVRVPVHHLPLPCHPVARTSFSRRHFGISETAYVFVFSFDLGSYIQRKNPFALVSAFAKLRAARPLADVQLVIKVNHRNADPAAFARFLAAVEPFERHVRIVDRILANDEVKALIRAGDAYVSLHRSEGFGFGPAEAMYLGKPVVATAYSGNLDYMTPETVHLVPYTLVPVREGEYPYGAGQTWAEPDVDAAAAYMIALVDDPARGRVLGARASAHLRTHFSLRAAGLRYASRLEQIERPRASVTRRHLGEARIDEHARTTA